MVYSVAGTSGSTYGLRQPAVVQLTVRDRESGEPRRFSMARVEHEGTYAAIATLGAGPENLECFADVLADPRVVVTEGAWTRTMTAREVVGDERLLWWARAWTCGAIHDDVYATLQIRIFCLEAPELVVVEELPPNLPEPEVIHEPEPTLEPEATPDRPSVPPEEGPDVPQEPESAREAPLGGWPATDPIASPFAEEGPEPKHMRHRSTRRPRPKRSH